MKKYIFSFILLALMFLGCEPKERLNVNNPVCCMLDSVSVHYYLTTRKNVLTTTFRQGETMVVHYDLCNLRKMPVEKGYTENVCIWVESSNPYLNALHGKCYTEDGRLVESMSFTPTSLVQDEDWWYGYPTSSGPNETIRLEYMNSRSYKREIDITLAPGEYYFETTPQLSTLSSVHLLPPTTPDTLTFVANEPLRVYFSVFKP